MGEKKASIQLVWGIMLVLAGVGVIVRVNLLETEIEALAGQPLSAIFIRICVYVMAILLVGGGLKKIRRYYMSGPGSSQ